MQIKILSMLVCGGKIELLHIITIANANPYKISPKLKGSQPVNILNIDAIGG